MHKAPSVHTFLTTPIDPRELFSFIGRFRERKAGKPEASAAPKAARRAAPSRALPNLQS